MNSELDPAAEIQPDNHDSPSGLDELLTRPLLDASGAQKEVNENPVSGVALGRIQAVTAEGIYIVVPILGSDPVQSLSFCPLSEADIGRTCAVQFVGGDKTRPCVLGCLIEGEPQDQVKEIQVDGQRLVIQAEQEIELKCGESAIIMKRNGVIELRGNYITSHATATQRIRGGSVHVN